MGLERQFQKWQRGVCNYLMGLSPLGLPVLISGSPAGLYGFFTGSMRNYQEILGTVFYGICNWFWMRLFLFCRPIYSIFIDPPCYVLLRCLLASAADCLKRFCSVPSLLWKSHIWLEPFHQFIDYLPKSSRFLKSCCLAVHLLVLIKKILIFHLKDPHHLHKLHSQIIKNMPIWVDVIFRKP